MGGGGGEFKGGAEILSLHRQIPVHDDYIIWWERNTRNIMNDPDTFQGRQ